MNRLVLIGNGFDLAHGLKTSYENFINWYWDQRLHNIVLEHGDESKDTLCSMRILHNDDCGNWFSYSFKNSYFKDIHNDWKLSGKKFIDKIIAQPDSFKVTFSPFFERIIKSIETKKWVDIENEYYELLTRCALKGSVEITIEELNNQLHFLQEKLIEYLGEVNEIDVKPIPEISEAIYSQFRPEDISIEGMHTLKEHIESNMKLSEKELDYKLWNYGKKSDFYYVEKYKKGLDDGMSEKDNQVPFELLFPNQIMLLNFNYTKTAELYCPKDKDIFTINQIHGNLDNPKSVIFGYGDEMDNNYKKLSDKNDNVCLGNIKSIRYLEADNYRKIRSFIESEPFQIIIMGHSCGNSDRTLLNTLFEHKNCVSIKPYFYKKDDGSDNYLDIVQNISRNFKDMTLMRDRVVNRTYCQPLTTPKENEKK